MGINRGVEAAGLFSAKPAVGGSSSGVRRAQSAGRQRPSSGTSTGGFQNNTTKQKLAFMYTDNIIQKLDSVIIAKGVESKEADRDSSKTNGKSNKKSADGGIVII